MFLYHIYIWNKIGIDESYTMFFNGKTGNHKNVNYP